MCFGCGKDNPIGLKLCFTWDGKTARAEFVPGKLHQGWSGIIHGGIIVCLLDEAMSYATYLEGIHCLTAEMHARLKRLAQIDEPLIITATITKRTRKLVVTRAAIALKDGSTVAEGEATMFVFDAKPGDKAKRF